MRLFRPVSKAFPRSSSLRRLEREGKRGINKRLKGKGKALPLLLCPSCSFISFMTLLFPFLLAFSPAETLATQHTGYIFFGYNRPEILSSFLPFYRMQLIKEEYRLLPEFNSITSSRYYSLSN